MGDLSAFEAPKIDWNPSPDLTTRFKRFKQKCELLFEGPLKKHSGDQKCRYLLLWVGDYGLDLYNTWNLTETERDDLKEYWARFEDHVRPQANHILNRYYLRSLRQNGRPLDEFLTEAKLLIQGSGFPETLYDELMRDSLVFGIDSDTTRRKCIAEGNTLTFQKAREFAKTEEATKMQIKAMTPDQSQVNLLRHDKSKGLQGKSQFDKKSRGKGYQRNRESKGAERICGRCGYTQHGRGQRCPATDLECHACHKSGHFKHMCNTKKAAVNTLQGDDDYSSESDYDERVFLGTLTAEQYDNADNATGQINTIQSQQSRTKVITEMHFTSKPRHRHTTPIKCKIDTGAELNVISMQDYEKLVPNPKERQLGLPQCKITAYGGHDIANMGTCQLYIHHKGDACEAYHIQCYRHHSQAPQC